VERFKIIAFTHKTTDINDIGKFHMDESDLKSRLEFLKKSIGAEELLYLSTCNRVEFMLSINETIDTFFLKKFFNAFDTNLD
jgi:glutamyl-tRNA reductase